MIVLMITDLSWKDGDLTVFLPVVLAAVSFAVYWFTAKSEVLKQWFYSRYASDQASINHIAFNRIAGFVVMGLVPAIIALVCMRGYSLASFGLTYRADTALFSLAWTLGLTGLVVPVAFFSAQKPKNLANYPQIRALVWTRRTMLINALTWALYLLGYEFLFRGLLLFPLAGQIGVWPAIAVNMALYSATHVPKGLEETVGALPLGLVLCLLTLASGTLWIAFLVHVAMALTNSFTALKYNPEMTIKNK